MPQSNSMLIVGELHFPVPGRSRDVGVKGMASASVSGVGTGRGGDDESTIVQGDCVNLSAGFLMPASTLDMGVHVVERVFGKKHVAPEIWVEENPVAHGNGLSITSPS